MRTMWKGAISFGLVNVPVKLYTATESSDIKFNFLHSRCKTPIKYEKRCPTCDEVVSPEEIVRGYEYEKGKYVIMREEDFDDIAIEQTRTVDIIDFVDLADIDPIYYAKTYFLVPNDGGQKAYALLRKAMEESGKIAIAKVVIRSKQHLAAVRVYENCLVMETMFFPAEIRSPVGLTELNYETKLNEGELKMAVDLIENLAEHFEPGKYTDDYRKALLEVIESKIEGKDVAVLPARPETGKVIDLMEALRASIQLAQQEKGIATTETEGVAPTGTEGLGIDRFTQTPPSPNVRSARPEPEQSPRRRRATGE
ncbi:MAG TPA: Ku protein [Verrucomicrobiae bacterium]|nr:Ku protein [Verrucomicrobiae bacterium]